MASNLPTNKSVTDSAATAAEKRRRAPGAMSVQGERGKLTPERISKLLRAMDARSLAKRKQKEN